MNYEILVKQAIIDVKIQQQELDEFYRKASATIKSVLEDLELLKQGAPIG